jgi:hypothetical protein
MLMVRASVLIFEMNASGAERALTRKRRSENGIEMLKLGERVMRDIDYGAVAVKNAIVERYGRSDVLANLHVEAKETTILVEDGEQVVEGTRDNLLIALRKSGSYANFWEVMAANGAQSEKASAKTATPDRAGTPKTVAPR